MFKNTLIYFHVQKHSDRTSKTFNEKHKFSRISYVLFVINETLVQYFSLDKPQSIVYLFRG